VGATIGFYANFALDARRLSSALGCVLLRAPKNRSELAECMGMNDPVGESYLGWLRHCGLLVKEAGGIGGRGISYELTPFGRLVAENDPAMRGIGTLWLLHYYLVVAHQERSDAWHVLFNEFLAPGRTFTQEQYTTYFTGVCGPGATNSKALKKDPEIALGTYTKQGVLTRLGILSLDGANYRVNQPAIPPLPILVYMLFDWWDRRYPQTTVLRRTQIAEEPDSIGRLCMASSAVMERIVRELGGRDYIRFSSTEHESVSRLYIGNPLGLLEEHYVRP